MDKGGQRERLRVIVDASVASKWIIPGGPWDEQARALEEKIAYREVEAYAPMLLAYEVASVIRKAVSRDVLRVEDGVEALKAMGYIGVNLQDIEWRSTAEMLEIAMKTGLTIYDSAYIYLSKKLQGRLITADDELKRRGEEIAEITLLRDLTQPKPSGKA
ncbi:TPA: PIN domain-containing protein [Candidatus Poribacteria bacterium]|nr:PIN domain-containing protein [Candidatus Poribacteria bacterium]